MKSEHNFGECSGCGEHNNTGGHQHEHEEKKPKAVCKVFESKAFQEVAGTALRPGGLELTKEAFELCRFHKEARLLDIGCGKGATLKFVSETYGFDIQGIDMSKELISQALSETPSLHITEGDAEFLEFPSFSFDGVLMECVLSLCDNQTEALHEAYCVLKKGGRLILSDLYLRRETENGSNEPEKARKENHSAAPGAPQIVTCINGAFKQETIIRMTEEIGFKNIQWFDRSNVLKQFTVSAILKYGSLPEFWKAVLPEEVDKEAFQETVCSGKPGYFLLIAEKPL